MNAATQKRRIRYAVVGLGHIAQKAILPAFANARRNSELVALVSGDEEKLRKVGRKYGVKRTVGYDGYEELLESGEVDAVYITVPNYLHRDYTIRAAERGVHVLCEKPMAVSSAECEEMIASAVANDIRLMIAYRLHFEEANTKAMEIVRSGKIGDPRFFSSIFSLQVREGDTRLVPPEKGGGPLFDIGVYCINAARYLFRSEPVEVQATAVSDPSDERFRDIDEAVSVIMTFPENRVATFICSFGAASTEAYTIAGTKGDLELNPAYGYAHGLRHRLTIGGKSRETSFTKRDQFAPELIHFSDCIMRGTTPEPSGTEGLIDVLIVEAIEKSLRSGRRVKVRSPRKGKRPGLQQELWRPAVAEPTVEKEKGPTR